MLWRQLLHNHRRDPNPVLLRQGVTQLIVIKPLHHAHRIAVKWVILRIKQLVGFAHLFQHVA